MKVMTRNMRKRLVFLALIAGMAGQVWGQVPVEKSNPMKVYMHYMPWFETPETIGGWGWHWTMNTMDPDHVGADGQREIASHYYPLIGPYASRDKDVIEYHLLLMKLSGIDGVLIDWYGTVGSNGDVKNLLKSSDSIVSYTDDFGMEFGVVMEDRFSRSINDVKANLAYLKNNYFPRDEYIRTREGNEPLVCIFGPVTFEDPADWTDALPSAGEEVAFLPLWYESGDAGSNADGEYSWVYQDETDHLTHLTNFYTTRAGQVDLAMSSAYPGFNDFYSEGGVGSGYFSIPHYYGSTLTETLGKAEDYSDRVDMLQLVTFNDFGEGTMFEPTVESGFDYLVQVQDYTGVVYGESDLELVHRLFLLRKDYEDDSEIQQQLEQASQHLRNLEIDQAATILNGIELKSDGEVFLPGEEGNAGLSVFPNPWSDGPLQIRVSPELRGPGSLRVHDLTGRLVYHASFEPGGGSMGSSAAFSPDRSSFLLDRSQLPQPGIYTLTYRSASGVATRRMIVH